MPIELTSSASIRRKTKEQQRIDSVMPSEWLRLSEDLLVLLRDYYNFLGLEGQPTYEINRILESRDIDTADEKYLDQIQLQLAPFIPRALPTNKRNLYRGLVQFYKIRGSLESIDIFFQVFLQDTAQVRYPFDQVLIPSSGNWDPTIEVPVFDDQGVQTGTKFGRYLDNKGFLSDNIFIQDSFFYQKYSYVIQTGTNQAIWGLPYSKLIHPAGFIFFSEIVLLIFAVGGEDAVQSAMPRLQPGFIALEDLPLVIELFASAAKVDPQTDHVEFVDLLKRLQSYYDTAYFETTQDKWIKQLKFFDTTPVEYYKEHTFEDFENFDINRTYNVGTIITQTSNV